jgi:hypothetical protein
MVTETTRWNSKKGARLASHVRKCTFGGTIWLQNARPAIRCSRASIAPHGGPSHDGAYPIHDRGWWIGVHQSPNRRVNDETAVMAVISGSTTMPMSGAANGSGCV